MVGNRVVSCGIGAAWLLLACSGPASAQQNPVLDVSGFQQNRDYFNDVSFEYIDTLSGNVILTFTDLALPGNGGRALRFQRTYNSKAASGGGVGIAGIPLTITDSSLGLQGPYPPGIDPQEFPVLVSTADGGTQRLAWDTVGAIAVSKQFWRYDRVAQTLSMSDGVVCHYDGGAPVPGTPTLRRVTECEDQYSTFVQFSYPPNRTEITQRLGGSDTRVITYDFVSGVVQSLSYDSRTWTYGTTVTPPVGPGWQYASTGTLLTQVTTPRGGVITYEYGTASYEQQNSPNPAYTQVLTKRVTGGTLPPSCREYDYVIGMDGLSSTTTETISSSCGGTLIKRVVYTYGAPISPDAVYDGDIAGLTRRVVQGRSQGDWVDLEQEDTDYTVVPVLNTSLGTLEPATRTVTRVFGAARPEYTTTYVYSPTNSGDYHQPTSITETGDAGTRTTVRTYQHLQAPYVVALPTFESVSAGGETFSKSWTYTSTGFRESQTVYGITTTFMRDDLGNIRRATKADGQFTEFSYAWGVLKDTVTPEFPVTRVINPDGTVASQTQAGRTTTFGYDAVFRITQVDPPGASQAIDTTYDNTAGGWIRVQRGSAFTKTTVDGFGRPTNTENSLGVRTRTAYDAEGRVVYEGQPYRDLEGAGDIGTVIAYDALGRVLSRTAPGAPAATWTYGPGSVTYRDELGRDTVRTMSAFGDPEAARLTGLIDAGGHAWAYAYDAIGQLRSVQAADGTTRSWLYWPGTDRLQSESHPESGTTQFVYDTLGRLAQRTDARNTTFTYGYDGNDRVRTIAAGTEVTQIIYEAGSDNRQFAANASAGTAWHHDPATGRLQTRDDVIDGMVFTTGFEYDGNDRLSAMVYPSGRRLQFVVNTEGQVTRVFDQTANRDYATAVSYHPSGGVTSYASSNGLTTTVEYDPQRYWVKRIAAGPLDFSYDSYDHAGNPLAVGDTRPGYAQSFGYDALDRLTAAVGPYGSSAFNYDLHGNRSGGGYQYDSATNRLVNQYGVAFTYDANGNTLTAGAETYTYTPQNQLHTATGTGGSVMYSYDADQQRVRKAVSDSTSYFMRGPGGELLTEWKDPGTDHQDIRDYVYLGTRLLASASRPTPFAGTGTFVPSSRSHRYAASWQVPSGTGGNAVLTSGVTAAARKSSHPDMPPAGLRIGVQALGTVDTYTPGPAFPNTGALPKQAGVFVEFEVERYPFTSDAEWLATDGGGALSSATDDLRLYMTATGTLVLKHDGSRTTPQTLWTSPAVGLRTPHTLEVRFEHNVNGTHPAPNPVWEDLTSWVRVYFDGAPVATYGASEGSVWQSSETSVFGLDVAAGTTGLSSVKLKSPGSTNGLLLNVWRVGLVSEGSHGAALDQYGTNWRTTLLESAGQGSYAEWTGGQPDWRARAAGGGSGGFLNPVTTSVAGKKISYLMESMISRGITGKIGTVLVGVRMGTTVSANSRAFVKRNGVETTLTNLVLQSGTFKWYRVAESGWLATDTVEIGVTCGDNATNSLQAVALLVEHNTPEPPPLTDSTVRVLTVNYTGNGGVQTVDLGLNQRPTALFVLPAQGVQGTNLGPLWWWDSRLGASAFTDAVASFGRVWPQRGRFHVLHTAGDSYNIANVPYVAIALFDPAARYVLPFAVSKATAEDNYTHQLRHPQTGALASTFTPDFVFGGAAFQNTGDAVRASLYRGPGHAGDLTSTLGSAQAAAADRIQAVGAGTVQFGTAIGQHGGDVAFWAGRVSDGVSSGRLMAVTSYVGTGTVSRTVGLTLNGQMPVFVLVVPTSSAARVYRVSGDSAGRNTTSGSAVANSVTALGADQITVGIALNATGVTYDVWAITTGVIAPY